jgi:hypothetical protein
MSASNYPNIATPSTNESLNVEVNAMAKKTKATGRVASENTKNQLLS